MLKNYIAVALRNIRREKAYAFINIAGLAIGLTICLLVMAYIVDEWSFDRFHADADRLFRVNIVTEGDRGTDYLSSTPLPLRPMIIDNVPDVDAVAQVIGTTAAVVQVDGKSFRETISFADAPFFEMFSFPLVQGDPSTALAAPNNIVLTVAAAERMFGTLDVVGKQVTLTLDGPTENYIVSAVAEDQPIRSTIIYGSVISMSETKKHLNLESDWGIQWPETYVRIRPDADPAAVSGPLNAAGATVPRQSGYEDAYQFFLQPIHDIHLNPEVNTGRPVSSPLYSYLLGGIGAIVLLLACINFTTLAIGRSQRRVREIGVRKVMGASVKQLYVQLLGEASIISGLALVLAFALAELFLPIFNDLSGKAIDSVLFTTGWWALGMVGLVLLTALFAGGYPATVLTKTRTVEAVRGKSRMLTGGTLTRTLVTVQFTLSAALIVITLTMSKQLNYMQSRPLGFNKDHVLMVSLEGASAADRLAITERLRAILNEADGVLAISASGTDFEGTGHHTTTRVGEDSATFHMANYAVDHEYLRTMQIPLVAGTNFHAQAPTEYVPVIVNETFVKQLGWENAIGKEVPGVEGGQIVGVAKDYHTRPLASTIEPVTLAQASPDNAWANSISFACIRISPDQVPATIQRIEEVWKDIAPHLPFSFEFMEEHIEAQYRSYERWASIMGNAASLAVIVACFGVFGLTALAIARRRKELGIRKVLGAKTGQLVGLLNREFVILTVAGNLVAWPLAYWAVNEWLAGFAYRTPLSPWPFAAGILMLLGIVVITVSVQAVRAARTNPTDAIRYE